jgi:hypothetical protein
LLTYFALVDPDADLSVCRIATAVRQHLMRRAEDPAETPGVLTAGSKITVRWPDATIRISRVDGERVRDEAADIARNGRVTQNGRVVLDLRHPDGGRIAESTVRYELTAELDDAVERVDDLILLLGLFDSLGGIYLFDPHDGLFL